MISHMKSVCASCKWCTLIDHLGMHDDITPTCVMWIMVFQVTWLVLIVNWCVLLSLGLFMRQRTTDSSHPTILCSWPIVALGICASTLLSVMMYISAMLLYKWNRCACMHGDMAHFYSLDQQEWASTTENPPPHIGCVLSTSCILQRHANDRSSLLPRSVPSPWTVSGSTTYTTSKVHTPRSESKPTPTLSTTNTGVRIVVVMSNPYLNDF